MNMDFPAAMRAATQLTRAQKLVEATRVIQTALSGRRPVPLHPLGEQAPPSRRAIEKTIDLTPEVTEPEITAYQGEAETRSEGPRRHHRTAAPATWRVGDVVRTLRQAKLRSFSLDAVADVEPRKALEIPDGAQFLNRSFACAAGSRSYKLYVPHRRRGGRCPLLVMLHGGTQDADDFAAGTRMNVLAEEYGLIVAYPHQSKIANPSLCWNWFNPEDQMRGAGEPSIIAGITNEIVAAYDVDLHHVFVAGLSAGGAMAAVMGATYPEVYAAVGVHSGLAYRSASDVASAFAAMHGDHGSRRRGQWKPRRAAANDPRIRTIVFHGDADQIVHPSNAAKIIEAQTKIDDSVERAKTRASASRAHTRAVTRDKAGLAVMEQWLIHGSGHAWSGGSPDGTYTDPQGPNASREMLRFFLTELAPADR
jgi:poly(hydroxyalkanoate) depolymerase family esterase